MPLLIEQILTSDNLNDVPGIGDSVVPAGRVVWTTVMFSVELRAHCPSWCCPVVTCSSMGALLVWITEVHQGGCA